jgi:hypothetical protein
MIYTAAAVVCMPIQPDCTDEEYMAVLGKLGKQCVAGNWRECTWDKVPCTSEAVTCEYSMCGFNSTSTATCNHEAGGWFPTVVTVICTLMVAISGVSGAPAELV